MRIIYFIQIILLLPLLNGQEWTQTYGVNHFEKGKSGMQTKDGLVNITVYDMMGRIVKTLVNSSQTAGYKAVQWNATDNRNEPVSAGLYLYTIQAGEFRQTKKMMLLK